MQKKNYQQAAQTFTDRNWSATAAYRAGNYKEASEAYSTLQDDQGNYNLGNALVHLGEYEKAIAAYNNALAINPQHADALYNRKIIQDLLKKDKEQQNKEQQNKEQQNKEQQNKEQQNKEQQNKEQQNKEQQNKEQQNKEQQNKEQQNKEQQNKEQQNKEQQNKEQQNKEQQNKEQQNKEQQNKEQQNKEQQSKQEEQAAKEQWLKLIPDDPGGLMRQKFLRDYLKRQNGWN